MTNSDRIRILEMNVSGLEQRLDNVRRDIARLEKTVEDRETRSRSFWWAIISLSAGAFGAIGTEAVKAAWVAWSSRP